MRFKVFGSFRELHYGLSAISDGPMKLGVAGSSENRQRFFEAHGLSDVVSPEIVHGNVAVAVEKNDAGTVVTGADALVTRSPDLYLTATVADCFPVFFVEPNSKIVAIAHAGWRGIAGVVIANTIGSLGQEPAGILCGIGPGIQQHHFEAKEDVAQKFSKYPEFIKHDTGWVFIDLPGIIRRQLLELGLDNANIETDSDCTYCRAGRYFSFRRDHPEQIEAMVAYIGFKDEEN